MAVVGATFLLSWVAEIAQHDIPWSLALTILALIAMLSENAVELEASFLSIFVHSNQSR